MKFNLNREERVVLKILQGEEDPLLATDVANMTGLDNREVMDAFASLAEKELFILEDRTAGEISEGGKGYNLFEDESLIVLSDELDVDTNTLLQCLLDDPSATISARETEVTYGLSLVKIWEIVDQLENLGYPARLRIGT